jgi:hypothetical protein
MKTMLDARIVAASTNRPVVGEQGTGLAGVLVSMYASSQGGRSRVATGNASPLLVDHHDPEHALPVAG